MPDHIPSSAETWFVYLLECSNGRLYTGITRDLERRFRQHHAGKGAMFTRLNRPERMLAALACADRSAASRLEWRIKQLSAADKRLTAAAWPLREDLPTRAALVETG